jgi:hypothetical protein
MDTAILIVIVGFVARLAVPFAALLVLSRVLRRAPA